MSDKTVDPLTFTRVTGPDDDPDAAILELFWQWRSALTAVNSVTGRGAIVEFW